MRGAALRKTALALLSLGLAAVLLLDAPPAASASTTWIAQPGPGSGEGLDLRPAVCERFTGPRARPEMPESVCP